MKVGNFVSISDAIVNLPFAIGAVTTQPENTNQISTERSFVGNSMFTRTVWLPRPVDSDNVAAKLDDGILTITVPKAQDKASVVVPVQ